MVSYDLGGSKGWRGNLEETLQALRKAQAMQYHKLGA